MMLNRSDAGHQRFAAEISFPNAWGRAVVANAALYFWSFPVLDLPSLKRGGKMAGETKYQGVYPALVTKIIASYVSHHNVSPEQIPELINSVHRTINNLGKAVEPQGALTPAVPVRRSVQRDAVICLECG